MSRPRYLLELYGSNFQSEIICRGDQLALILNEIKRFPLNGLCYIGDIDTNFTTPFVGKFSGWKVKKLGSIEDLINFSSSVGQFLSGVFFIFSQDHGDELQIEYSTEDPKYRDFGDALIEIRTFDTSCFEIYSNDFGLLKRISDRFGKSEIKEGNET